MSTLTFSESGSGKSNAVSFLLEHVHTFGKVIGCDRVSTCVTIEALLQDMSENEGCALLVNDEASRIKAIAQYKTGGSEDVELFMEAQARATVAPRHIAPSTARPTVVRFDRRTAARSAFCARLSPRPRT